jgi:hypothetical protein
MRATPVLLAVALWPLLSVGTLAAQCTKDSVDEAAPVAVLHVMAAKLKDRLAGLPVYLHITPEQGQPEGVKGWSGRWEPQQMDNMTRALAGRFTSGPEPLGKSRVPTATFVEIDVQPPVACTADSVGIVIGVIRFRQGVPKPDGSFWMVTLRRTGGTWTVAGMKPYGWT